MLVLLFGFLEFIFKFGVYVFWQKVSISYTNYVGIVGTYGIQCPEMCISQRPCFHLWFAGVAHKAPNPVNRLLNEREQHTTQNHWDILCTYALAFKK